MMTCDRCHRLVPEGKISCPNCAQQRNADAIRRFQFEPLLTIAGRKGQFTIHKTPTGNHAQMFGPGVQTAYCGQPADAPRKKRYPIDYGVPAYHRDVCAECRAAIEELLVEARTTEAMKTA